MSELLSVLPVVARDLPLAAVAVFMVVNCGTPGPGNFFMLASGARVGFRRTVSAALGIACGFAVMIMAQSLVISHALRAAPWAELVLQALFSAFLLWLAWQIATSGPVGSEDEEGGKSSLLPIPLGFVRSLGFPFLNPKAWGVAASVPALYGSGDPARDLPLGDLPVGESARALPEALVFAVVAFAVAAVVHSAWAGVGSSLRAFLADARRARVFNLVMAGALAAVVAWGWLPS